jgi:hypothetical protein
MAESAPREFLHQLTEYLTQRPPREYPINRGHRTRHFSAARLNRYIPNTKRVLGSRGEGALCGLKLGRNNTSFVSTAAPIYNATTTDYHISVNVGVGVVVNLPLAASAGLGKIMQIKDTFGIAAPPTPIAVTPVGADTLERGGPILMVVAFQVLRLISDGMTNWEVI